MKLLTTLVLLIIGLTAEGQTSLPKKGLTFYPGTYIDTEARYTDSTGIVVIIQNSLPKGGLHTDAVRKKFGYRMFWMRVINETDKSLDLTMHFSPYSFANLSSLNSFLKVFLPQDTMTIYKEPMLAYGVAGLDSFLDSRFNKPTFLQRTINPKEASAFYIGVLFTEAYGAARAELILKEQELFFRIRGITREYDSVLIPCGQLLLKK